LYHRAPATALADAARKIQALIEEGDGIRGRPDAETTASAGHAMAAAPSAFRFDGERCDQITASVLSELELLGSS
jgi:hypothetical protein